LIWNRIKELSEKSFSFGSQLIQELEAHPRLHRNALWKDRLKNLNPEQIHFNLDAIPYLTYLANAFENSFAQNQLAAWDDLAKRPATPPPSTPVPPPPPSIRTRPTPVETEVRRVETMDPLRQVKALIQNKSQTNQRRLAMVPIGDMMAPYLLMIEPRQAEALLDASFTQLIQAMRNSNVGKSFYYIQVVEAISRHIGPEKKAELVQKLSRVRHLPFEGTGFAKDWDRLKDQENLTPHKYRLPSTGDNKEERTLIQNPHLGAFIIEATAIRAVYEGKYILDLEMKERAVRNSEILRALDPEKKREMALEALEVLENNKELESRHIQTFLTIIAQISAGADKSLLTELSDRVEASPYLSTYPILPEVTLKDYLQRVKEGLDAAASR
jgi:hypothetical protein